MDAAHLSSDDARFSWNANLGGDLDVVGWERGHATFRANYEVVLGDQLRRFDPNQGNYMLEGSIARRAGAFELSALFHHMSRHLSDRPKQNAVDWNMLGIRVRRSMTNGPLSLNGRADVRGVLAKSSVDYRWELDGEVASRYALRPRIGLITMIQLRILGVDGSRNRGTQTGLRGEGGVRLDGAGASVELFVAAERRIDPYQLETGVGTWVAAGFRMLSR